MRIHYILEYAVSQLLDLLLCILQFLLLPLWHQVIQPTQFSLSKDKVQQLTDEHQGQDLMQQSDVVRSYVSTNCVWGTLEYTAFTIMGKTMAALDVLMTQSRTKQLSWMMVKRCTFLSGT